MSDKGIGYTLKAVGKILVSGAGLTLATLNEALPIVPEQFKTEVTVVIGVLTVILGYFAPYRPLAGVRGSAGQPGGSNRASKRTAMRARRPRKAVGTSQVPIVRDLDDGPKHAAPEDPT